VALDTDRIGTSYPAWVHDVSRTKIHEYARALGEDDRRYLAGPDDDVECVAPPTYAAIFTLEPGAEALMADEGLGAHWNLVHGGQSYDYGPRPLRPGDRLRCTPTITDIRARGDNEMLTIEVDCRFDDTDERAVLSTGTIVFLGSAPSQAPAGGSAPSQAPAGGSAPSQAPDHGAADDEHDRGDEA
jgi:hypothetical protein